MQNPMIAQIRSLPEMVHQIIPAYSMSIQQNLTPEFCTYFDHLYLMGCGDSHHVSVATQLAFRVLAGVETEALTAMQFARYTAETLHNPQRCLVVGASVSGEVSRTLEGMLMARKAGVKVMALTATPTSRIGRAADVIVDTTQPAFKDPEGMVIPGVRSFVANQVGLLLVALHLGEKRGHLSGEELAHFRGMIDSFPGKIQDTIQLNEEVTEKLADTWLDASEFVFCGSGSGYAAALFSAAKILETSGDSAIAQDMEEWAHLQYFAKKEDTPTFIISAGERDASRASEVVTAAKAIGRRVALIAPDHFLKSISEEIVQLPVAGGLPEMFQSLLSFIPGSLFAAYRAERLGEPYFRDFGGGRSKEGGGGISRIRTSEIVGLEYLKGEAHE